MSITPFKALINNTRDNYVYMSPDGNDSNTGEADSPVKSLKRALEIASEYGRSVWVKPGTYDISDGFDPSLTFLDLSITTIKRKMWDKNENINFDVKPAIVGELTQELDLSSYTITVTRDASGSYSVLSFSPDPGWTDNQWQGKIISTTTSTKTYYYRVISNTHNTLTINKGLTSINTPKLYSAPVFIMPPNTKYMYIDVDYTWSYIDFNCTNQIPTMGLGYNRIQPIFNVCYFYVNNGGPIGAGLYHSSAYYASNCLFRNIRVGQASAINRHNVVATHVFSAVIADIPGSIEAAFYDIENVGYCSAWNCKDFFQTSYVYNSINRYFIRNAGGSGNTGAFINTHTPYVKNNCVSILLEKVVYVSGVNPYTINVRDIIVEDGYKISLDAIPIHTFTNRAKIIKLIENDIGAKIYMSGG